MYIYIFLNIENIKFKKFLALALDESSDSAIHTVYERIKGMKEYKMIEMEFYK